MRNPDREKRVEKIFHRLLNTPEGERDDVLQEECAGDEELLTELRSLLAHHEAAGSFLAEPVVRGFESTVQVDHDVPPPSEIGPYRILERLGEGGMGDVYLAEQSGPIQRRVALKVIKVGMDTKEVIARFESERQALAMMNHPNVARIFDAGSTENGRPYFAMEHVAGEHITTYCDRHRLDLEERLKLFVPVCEAIHHAHQKGIIHRDIKPSNVLVALVDGKPVPKVIDFGVAKAIQQTLTEKTIFTAQGTLVGTPAYMSPEQAEMTGLNVDTTSDVYSLGVLLYELLVGALPFDAKMLREAGIAEIHRIIREVEPPKPSTKFRTLGETATDVATRRRTVPGSWQRLLSGELDWITMRAMEKDRSRRYQSAYALSEDVDRYLRDEAVLAGPPSQLYRFKKTVSRNKLAAAFTATVLVLLIGFGVSMGFLRQRAEEAREEAQARAQELQRVTEFQASMLSTIDAEAMGSALVEDLSERVRQSLEGEEASPEEVESALATFEETLARISATDAAVSLIDEQILERAVQTIGEEFADQPEVQAALQHTVAVTYGAIGRDASALPLQEAALETRRRRLGDLHPETLASISSMCEILRRMGRFDEALDYCREAFEGSRTALGEDHAATLLATNNLGYVVSRLGDDEEALALYRTALESSRRALGNDHPETVRSLNNVGALLMEKGELEEALVYYTQSLEGCRRVFGPDHPNTLAAISNMGALYYHMGKPEEAIVYLREALELRQRTLGRDHPQTIASTQNIGILLQSMGRYEEALVYQREAVERNREVLGDDHPSTLQMTVGMAVSLREIGELEQALRQLRESTDSLRGVLGNDHPVTLGAIAGMSQVLMAMDRFDEALVYGREAMEGRRQVLGEDNPKTLGAIGNMGRLLTRMGRRDEALELHREALEGFRRVLGDEHPSTLAAIEDLASLLLEEEPERALELLEPAEERARRAYSGNRANRLGVFLVTMGRTKAAMGDFDDGRALLEEAYDILVDASSAKRDDLEDVCAALVALHRSWHDTEPNAGHDRIASQWQLELDELRANG